MGKSSVLALVGEDVQSGILTRNDPALRRVVSVDCVQFPGRERC